MAPMKRDHEPALGPFGDTLSLSHLAKRWKLPVKEIRRLLAEQQLAFIEIRGRLRVPRDEVERYEQVTGRATLGSEPNSARDA